MALHLILILFVVLGVVGCALWYCIVFPRHSRQQRLPALDGQGVELADRLRDHINAIAKAPRNIVRYEALEAAAQYIEDVLEGCGLQVETHVFEVDGKYVRNIEVVFETQETAGSPQTLVVGAHYDTDSDSPGAHDNGTGVAAALELARLLSEWQPDRYRFRLVFWVNEERPYGKTPNMGSWQHAKMLKDAGERVIGAVALETLGYFDSNAGSQKFPTPFNLVYSDTGDFIAFVALPGSRTFLGKITRTFRRNSPFPSIGGLAPGFVEGVDLSDHWSYHQFGYPALMITDTAPFRNPFYHSKEDLPHTVDYTSLAHITMGLDKTVRALTE